MGVLVIFDGIPGDIWLVFCRFLVLIREIFNVCHVDILYVSFRYLIGVLKIFVRCPGDI